MYSYASNHVGYTSNNLFHTQYVEADIKRQTAGLVLHLARYLLSMEPEPFPIAIRHDIQIDQEDISLYVSDAMTRWLIDKTKLLLIPSIKKSSAEVFLYQQGERLLKTNRVILVAYKLPMIVADTTENTVASILDAMTLNHNLRGIQLVDHVLMVNHLRPTLYCEADIQRMDAIINAIDANTSLPLRKWSSIETAGRLANQSRPTCLWKETDDLLQDWICLTTIPAPVASD
jgi:hypothetical protein